MQAGPGPVLRFSLFLYFKHPSTSDEKNCSSGGNNRVHAATTESGSTVFRVCTAEGFCVQTHA